MHITAYGFAYTCILMNSILFHIVAYFVLHISAYMYVS